MNHFISIAELFQLGKSFPDGFCQEHNHEMDNIILDDFDFVRMRVRIARNPLAVVPFGKKEGAVIFFDEYQNKEVWCHLSEEMWEWILEENN